MKKLRKSLKGLELMAKCPAGWIDIKLKFWLWSSKNNNKIKSVLKHFTEIIWFHVIQFIIHVEIIWLYDYIMWLYDFLLQFICKMLIFFFLWSLDSFQVLLMPVENIEKPLIWLYFTLRKKCSYWVLFWSVISGIRTASVRGDK